ncbi:MAG: hypothetical protein QOE82_566 [Thermoanaerobaculia bacterium]|jgi:hypothetical protein|nr:hypothetical protein [Thermoanaerobaculia bacterium]
MKTRIPLFFVAVILLVMAPAAMAGDCKRCAGIPTQNCVNAFHVIGFLECFVDETGCHLDGEQCAPMGNEPALASEYTVAAVERVDEPQTPATTPLVAPAETENPTH